jgi:hypothetical protein
VTAVRISSAGIHAPSRQAREDGTPFPLEVVHEAWRLYADTADEILGLLIDGCADQPDEGSRLRARIGLAVEVQGTASVGSTSNSPARQ